MLIYQPVSTYFSLSKSTLALTISVVLAVSVTGCDTVPKRDARVISTDTNPPATVVLPKPAETNSLPTEPTAQAVVIAEPLPTVDLEDTKTTSDDPNPSTPSERIHPTTPNKSAKPNQTQPAKPTTSELIRQAQNLPKTPQPVRTEIPAVKKLITQGIAAFKSKQYTQSEQYFMRAQRLDARSDKPYYYLARVALAKQLASKAEAMARRGLLVSQSKAMDYRFWQIIAISGKLRERSELIEEARQAVNQLQLSN